MKMEDRADPWGIWDYERDVRETGDSERSMGRWNVDAEKFGLFDGIRELGDPKEGSGFHPHETGDLMWSWDVWISADNREQMHGFFVDGYRRSLER